MQQSRFGEPSLDDMMDEDAHMGYTVSNAHAWGGSVKNDSLTHEQDNVSSSTTVPGMVMGYGNVQHHGMVHHSHCDHHEDDMVNAGANTMHKDSTSAAVSQ